MKIDISTRIAELMDEAVAYSTSHVIEGGIPFTALVVDQAGTIAGRGVNRVQKECDPTAHAEVEAIRDACRQQRTPHLRGAILLASGEPCALCYMAAMYAGIGEIYFAASRDEAASNGFDYRGGYGLYLTDPLQWRSPKIGKLPVDGHLQPFKIFQERGVR